MRQLASNISVGAICLAWKSKKPYVKYVPRMLYQQLSPEAVTWGSKEIIARLFSEGKTEQEIVSLTKNRRMFVHNTIQRLEHPEEFVIEPIEVKESFKPREIICLECNKSFTATHYRVRYCSMFCRGRHNRQKTQEGRKLNKKGKTVLICKTCKSEFSTYTKTRMYCSRSCFFTDRKNSQVG